MYDGCTCRGAECRVIENANARLSCYDAAYPPKMEKSAVPDKDPSRAAYKDPFSAEDARTSAKLKNICPRLLRGGARPAGALLRPVGDGATSRPC
jgi:hypothetical protein